MTLTNLGIAGCVLLLLQQAAFRLETNAVVIDVSVRDGGRRNVTGLTAADFELRDAGMPQKIRLVSTEQVPLDVTLLVDDQHEHRPPSGRRLVFIQRTRFTHSLDRRCGTRFW